LQEEIPELMKRKKTEYDEEETPIEDTTEPNFDSLFEDN
jgi:hypothetical protein